MNILTNRNRRKFSIACAFFGVFGYFFHMNQIKGTGAGIAMFVAFIIMRICFRVCDPNIIISLLEIPVAGLIGGFIIDYYARPSFDIAIYNKREAIAAIAGVLMWVYILVL
jgi:hypothetical protein